MFTVIKNDPSPFTVIEDDLSQFTVIKNDLSTFTVINNYLSTFTVIKIIYPCLQLSMIIYPSLQLSKMIYPHLQLSKIIYPRLQLSKMIYPCLQLSKMVHPHLHLSQMIFQDQWCGCTWWGQFLFHQLCLLKIASRIYVWGHPVLALGKCCVLWWQVIWCCRWWSPHSKWRLIFTWHEVRFFFSRCTFTQNLKKYIFICTS